MNAIDFLVQEHNKVRKLFQDLQDPKHREETQKKLFLTITEELTRHEKMEQTIWYPQLKEHKKWQEHIKHLKEEEHSAKKFMMKLKNLSDSEDWQAGIKQLQEDVEHHATEEEEKLFPQVRKIIEEETLQRIGKDMRKFKEDFERKH
ncbi:MAG: hemerythrin domain-containing protein [Legionella sp.]|nr:hemerythrin domain-containing protein [Legionella sp.]